MREDTDVEKCFATVVNPFQPQVLPPDDEPSQPTLVEPFTPTVIHRRFTATLVERGARSRKAAGKAVRVAGAGKPLSEPAPSRVAAARTKTARAVMLSVLVLAAVAVYAFAVLGHDSAIGAISDRSVILINAVDVETYPYAGTELLVVVPLSALLEGDGQRGHVFVLADDNVHVKRVSVDIAAIDGAAVIINGSLMAGWRVVTDGAPLLKDGSSVRLSHDAS